jgi:hypothetical protein
VLDQSYKHRLVFSATAKWEQPHAVQLDLLGIFTELSNEFFV